MSSVCSERADVVFQGAKRRTHADLAPHQTRTTAVPGHDCERTQHNGASTWGAAHAILQQRSEGRDGAVPHRRRCCVRRSTELLHKLTAGEARSRTVHDRVTTYGRKPHRLGCARALTCTFYTFRLSG